MSPLLLLTFVMLAPVLPARAADLPVRSVCVDSTGVDSSAYARLRLAEVQKDLLVRLTQEGLAVRSCPDGEVAVRFAESADHQLLVSVAAAGTSREGRFVVAGEAQPGAELLLLHGIVALVRDAAAALPPVSEAPAVAAPLPSVVPAPATPPPPASPGPRLLTAVAAAPDLDGTALVLAVEAQLGGDEGPYGHVGLDGLRPLGLPSRLSIYEWGGAVGVGWRLPLGEALRLHAEVGAGAWQHRFTYNQPAGGTERGARFGVLALATAAITSKLSKSLEIGLRLQGRGTFVERLHRAGDEVIWRRAAVDAVLGVVFGWSP